MGHLARPHRFLPLLYPNLGHILSRSLDPRAQEEGPFDPDPDAVLDAHAKDESFLRRGGFLR
jgi:hypothetical protein